jgi:hypothetical protein
MVLEGTPQYALVTVTALLALTLVAIGVGFEFVFTAAEAAAEAAVDSQGYVDVVDPTTPSEALNASGNASAAGEGGEEAAHHLGERTLEVGR